MGTWADFEAAEPELAALGRALWDRTGILYLATTRADGSPRVHPVCPKIAGGRILVAIPPWSPKGADLLRDPRYVLHAMPGERDDELLIRGSSTHVAAHAELRAAGAHWTRDDDRVFELGIDRIDVGWWERVGQPDTSHVRNVWRAASHV